MLSSFLVVNSEIQFELRVKQKEEKKSSFANLQIQSGRSS
jgi:hypothetical protein